MTSPQDDRYASEDLLALVVVDEFPAETINTILNANEASCDGARYIWLADSANCSSLPDAPLLTEEGDREEGAEYVCAEGTMASIEPAWRSPFVGHGLSGVAAFIKNAPRSKPISRQYVAVLRKKEFEAGGNVVVCRLPMVDDGVGGGTEELQSIAHDHDELGLFYCLIATSQVEWQTLREAYQSVDDDDDEHDG